MIGRQACYSKSIQACCRIEFNKNEGSILLSVTLPTKREPDYSVGVCLIIGILLIFFRRILA
jgi:hypothetical protein